MESRKQKKIIVDGDVEHHDDVHEMSDLTGDYKNIAVLLFLYMLQGVPLGISGAIPILLQNRGISYKEQAGFSLAYWPFAVKLLWAPIVDSIYVKRLGRRKSWMVPSQLLIGVFMLYSAQHVNDWLSNVQITMLTFVFFCFSFLAATQDIAVDGWALTMLQRRNVGHAATCNSVGQTAGGFIGYVVFLVFESKEFCNKYLFSEPREQGLFTLSGYFTFWGFTFLITTILIAIFKHEDPDSQDRLEDHPDYGISKAYPLLFKIIKMKPVLHLAAVLLTVKISFAACDAITTLKLVDYGIPKDKIALLAIPLVPVQILLPFIISKYTTGPKPMNFYIRAFPFRVLLAVVIAVFVYATPFMIDEKLHEIPSYYYVLIVLIYFVYQIPIYGMFVSEMAFYARISDPLVGGTYMTLLNTLSNFGGRWIKTFLLWLVDIITWKQCVPDNEEIYFNSTISLTTNKCLDKIAKKECTMNGGRCQIDIDGYYIEVLLGVIYALFWYKWGKSTLDYLQSLSIRSWHVLSNNNTTKSQNQELVLLEDTNKV